MITPPDLKHPYVSNVDWALWRWMDIPDKTDVSKVYLRRLIIFKTPLCAVYVHQIFTPDSDRDPHNHPMNFWSWVVKGGYVEHRWFNGRRRRNRWSIARTTIADFHSIQRLWGSPTVTVMFCGRRQQDWGFMTKDGFVPQKEYLAEAYAP